MRGSPLLRTLLLLCALALSGIMLARLMHQPKSKPPTPVATELASTATITGRYTLTLSAPAQEVALQSALVGSPVEHGMSGAITLDHANPAFSIAIQFAQPPLGGTRHFTQIELVMPGNPTITRTYSSAGDIDDFTELPPFPATTP